MKQGTIKVTTPYGHPDVFVGYEWDQGTWYYTTLDQTGRPLPEWERAATWEELIDRIGTLIGHLFRAAVLTGDAVNPL